jgi:hypothetical protein
MKEVNHETQCQAIVIAETIVGAALFTLCRLAFAVAPEATLASLKYLTHIDWSPVTMPVTFSGFISGLVVFTIFMGAVGALWARIYNFMVPAPHTTFAESSPAKAGANLAVGVQS